MPAAEAMESGSESELEESFKYSFPKTFNKGEYLLRIGEYCSFVGFVNKGLIVTTIIDNTGNEKDNQILSEARAAAIKDYLVNKMPASAEKITAAGKGQNFPIAENVTAAGKQKNRRVAIVITYLVIAQ